MKATYVSEFIDESPRSHAYTRRVRCLAREVSRNGFTVDVISPQPLKVVAKDGHLTESESPLSMLTFGSKGNYLTRIIAKTLFFFSLIRTLRRERPRCVVVSFHIPVLGLFSTIAGKITCNRVVFECHDSWIVLSQTHHGKVRNRIRRWVERLSFRIANGVTTVSPTLKQLIVQRYRIDQNKVYTVYSGGDRPQTPLPTVKDIDIIHVGSPRIYYDTTELIDALGIVAKTVRKFNVVFLGTREDAYVEKIKAKTRSLGLEDHIKFEPPVRPSEVGGWLARSRVGVCTLWKRPEYSSALALKLFEYISYGLPVAYLGPSDSDTYRMIASNDLGITAPSAQEFAGKLIELVLDEGKRMALVERALYMAPEVSWTRSGEKLAQILNFV